MVQTPCMMSGRLVVAHYNLPCSPPTDHLPLITSHSPLSNNALAELATGVLLSAPPPSFPESEEEGGGRAAEAPATPLGSSADPLADPFSRSFGEPVFEPGEVWTLRALNPPSSSCDQGHDRDREPTMQIAESSMLWTQIVVGRSRKVSTLQHTSTVAFSIVITAIQRRTVVRSLVMRSQNETTNSSQERHHAG